MSNLSPSIRAQVVSLAKAQGFTVCQNDDGQDLYAKNMVLTHRAHHARVYVNKVVGVSKASGNFNYIKVAVHPAAFKPELVQPLTGIDFCLNARTGVNQHHSSNYADYPVDPRVSVEPYGACYRVKDLEALSVLLAGLTAG